jgi:hypothetical protein
MISGTGGSECDELMMCTDWTLVSVACGKVDRILVSVAGGKMVGGTLVSVASGKMDQDLVSVASVKMVVETWVSVAGGKIGIDGAVTDSKKAEPGWGTVGGTGRTRGTCDCMWVRMNVVLWGLGLYVPSSSVVLD